MTSAIATAGNRRTVGLLILTIAVLGVGDIARSVWIPGDWDIIFNIGFAVVIVAITAVSGTTTDELGLRRTDTRSGLIWGGAACVAISTVIVVAALIAPDASFFADDRADVSVGALLVKVLIVIPLATVILEELAFRGLLLALFGRITSTGWAVVAVSALFGVWHIPGAWSSSPLGIAATVIATAAAGVVFCWLRLRSRSLIAPALAHMATNSVAFTVAWFVAR
jgi:membrane protease YdiL (CAAX protease family)